MIYCWNGARFKRNPDVDNNNNATVCFHHKNAFHKQYPLQQKKCCDPTGLHCSTKKGIFFIWTYVILKCTLAQIKKIGEYLCLYIKITCLRFHIITPLLFAICTPEMCEMFV